MLTTSITAQGSQVIAASALAISTTLPGEDASDWPLTLNIDWDYPGQGAANYSRVPPVRLDTQAQGRAFAPTFSYQTPGVKRVRVRVQDADAAFSEETLTLNVRLSACCLGTLPSWHHPASQRACPSNRINKAS